MNIVVPSTALTVIPDLPKELISLINNCYFDYWGKKVQYDKMHDYYHNKTDAVVNYTQIDSRSNRTINFNFMNKFIEEEVSYSVGNDVTYISDSNDKNITDFVHKSFKHWSKKHNHKLCRELLRYGEAYELYYFDNSITGQNQFSCKIINPRHGYVYLDENDRPAVFLHIFQKKFDATTYIDVYTPDWIYHLNGAYGQIGTPTKNLFGVVPVGIAKLDYLTIYDTIKTIQDAYERNFSDISNEISDFRNAYLVFKNCSIDETLLSQMKEKGVINTPSSIGNADVQWLIKNINDTFIQNTLGGLEDKMYQLSSHINHNAKMQSNISGVALRSRLISLEDKCKLNEGALGDCINTRLQMLFLWDKIINGSDFDFRDMETKFTPNVPQDLLNTAQIIATLGDKISLRTALSLLPFVNNPDKEIANIHAEENENPIIQGNKILNNTQPENGGADDGQKATSTDGAN